VATGKEIRQFGGPVCFAGWLAFSPDGKYLAYGDDRSKPNTVYLAEVSTGKELRRFQAKWLIFSPDRKTLAYNGLDDSLVRVAEVDSGKELHKLGGHKGNTTRAAFAPDGKTLVTADKHTLRFFDLASGRVREVSRPEGQAAGFQPLTFSPDGKVVAASGGDKKTIRLVEVATGKTLRLIELKDKHEQIGSLLFTRDGKHLISTHEDGYVRYWDAATGAKRSQFRAHDCAVGRVALAPGGQTLATTAWSYGGGDYSVRLWETATGKPLVRHPGPRAGIRFLEFSPDSRRVAAASHEGAIHLFEATTGKLLRRWQLFGPVAFTPDGRTLLCGDWSNGKVRSLDVTTGKEARHFQTHPKGVYQMALSRDGKLLVTAGSDKFLRVWDPTTGRMVSDFGGAQKEYVWYLALSPDGRILASLHDGKIVRLWDTAAGKLIAEPTDPGNYWSVAFSADGTMLATSVHSSVNPADHFIRLRDAATGHEIRRMPGKNVRALEYLAFSPDGRTLISGSQHSRDLYLWEVATGQPRRHFSGHQGPLSCVAFAPDGRLMASGSHDGSVLVWDAAGRRRRLQPGAAPPRDDQLDGLWTDLASRETAAAYRAICRLRAAPRQAASLLERHLKPVPHADAKRVTEAIRNLGSAHFTIRSRAMRDLEAEAEAAEPALREALAGKPSEEVRRRIEQLLGRLEGAEELRRARALEVLEQADSPETRRVLTALARGAPRARLTRTAQAALDRTGR
jgi:WD40 repeat protein